MALFTLDNGCMGFVRVQSLKRLTPGSLTEVHAEGRTIALCNVDGTVHAIDGICPHAGGPLGHGALHGNTIVCPYHAWEFDCRTGQNDFDPAICMDRFAVLVDGDDILVDVSQRARTS